MRLTELRLNDFGKFHNKSITFQDGINLIYGDNEAGKSTIHSFIRGMLFGIEKLRGRASKDDTYEKFKPWEYQGSYYGSMDIESEGKNLRIIRNFDKNNKKFTIIDIGTGRELEFGAEELIVLYGDLTEAGYRNTISIEQLKIRTDQELAEEVRNYITNLSLSKSNEVDVTNALGFLQDKRKILEAGQISAKLAALDKEIEEGLKQETFIDKLTLQLKVTEDQEKILQKKRDNSNKQVLRGEYPSLHAYQTYLEQFPVVKEKYNNYKEAKQQRNLFSDKQTLIQEQLQEYQEDCPAILQKQVNDLDSLKYEISAREEEKEVFKTGKEEELKQEKKRRVISSVPIITGIAGILSFMGKSSFLTGLCIAILLSGIVLYLIFTGCIKRKQKEIDLKSAEYEKAIALLKDKVKAILIKFQAEDERILKKKYEEALRQEMTYDHLLKQKKDYMEQTELLNNKISALEQEILEYESRATARSDSTDSLPVILDDKRMEELEQYILQQKQSIIKNQEEFAKETESLRIQTEKLKWELSSLEGNEEKLLGNQELYKELVQQKSETDLELEAIKLSIETINSLSIDIHDSFGRKLNGLVSDLTMELTGHKYTDIKIDEKLNIKVGYKDNYVRLDKLSAGTIEQLYFALRIAVSDLVYGEGVMPILLDDCFALYDDKRTRAVLKYLSKHRQGQVLLFTCHNREKVILDELNLSYNYIDLSESN
ncbi:MAG: AAA family ATPase [Anaerocolumna sp.]